MTFLPHDETVTSDSRTSGAMDVVRSAVVVLSLLLVWITLDPFLDLRDPSLQNATSGRLTFTYAAFGVLAVISIALAASATAQALRSLMTPLHLCLVAWMAFNIAFSVSPAISLQRFVLTMSVIAVAATLPLIPPAQEDFRRSLAAAAMLLLALCYLGLMLAPQVAVHSTADVAEPGLVGYWRGSFAHKNTAAPVMAILVYIGIYVWTAGAACQGAIIAVLAGVFLVFSGGKSALAICVFAGILARLIAAINGFWLKVAICLLPILLMNAATVGGAISEPLAGLVRQLPIDPTFSGRTDIWRYAFEAFTAHPIKGYGYAAFWDTVRQDAIGDTRWASHSPHSHNSYLDLALAIGLPGLCLVILVFVIEPLRNFHRVQQATGDSPLTQLFLAAWTFGVYFANMETFLFDRHNPTWFMFVVATAGLHFLARFPLAAQRRA